MRLVLIQWAQKPENSHSQNLEQGLELARCAPECDLMLFPELWPSGAFDYEKVEQDGEPLDGPSQKAFANLAREKKCWLAPGSFVEQTEKGLANCLPLYDDKGELQGAYRKIHLFGYQSREAELLQAGTEPLVVESPWGKIGFAICYDLRFPELFRKLVDKGAQIFLMASAWPAVRLHALRLFNQSRAHENLAFLINANAAGVSGGLPLGGHSMVVDPSGKILAEAGEEENMVTVEINEKRVEEMRNIFPALQDRVFTG